MGKVGQAPQALRKAGIEQRRVQAAIKEEERSLRADRRAQRKAQAVMEQEAQRADKVARRKVKQEEEARMKVQAASEKEAARKLAEEAVRAHVIRTRPRPPPRNSFANYLHIKRPGVINSVTGSAWKELSDKERAVGLVAPHGLIECSSHITLNPVLRNIGLILNGSLSIGQSCVHGTRASPPRRKRHSNGSVHGALATVSPHSHSMYSSLWVVFLSTLSNTVIALSQKDSLVFIQRTRHLRTSSRVR